MSSLSAFMIVKNEEELVEYTMECFAALNDRVPLEVLSVIDNGSTDRTTEIIACRAREYRLPLRIRSVADTPHHGSLRSAAIEGIESDWIFYLDGDETFSRDLPEKVVGKISRPGSTLCFGFHRKWTIVDRYHLIKGAYESFQCRLFRNLPGVYFPQKIHTVPVYVYDGGEINGLEFSEEIDAIVYDHTSCKSPAALLEKGNRYQWAAGEPYIGDPETYLRLTRDAYKNGKIESMSPEEARMVFTGPERKDYDYG